MANIPVPSFRSRVTKPKIEYPAHRKLDSAKRPVGIVFIPRIKKPAPLPVVDLEKYMCIQWKFSYRHYVFMCGKKGNEKRNYTQEEITKRLENGNTV